MSPFIELVSLCRPGWSAVVRSELRAASTSPGSCDPRTSASRVAGTTAWSTGCDHSSTRPQNSWAQAILLPQAPKRLELQVLVVTHPTSSFLTGPHQMSQFLHQ
ncbi:CRTC3-AS1 isoform 2 [Pongo abelii]|uniref:CRTC3-AS1 isoform 2 n=1 Tax=Pongo abelii TaxID=9601 RepID=A0A2J8VXA7_PONAB|nr:CRTC3-AS1 isoform 2 [Pongo abelii]